MNSEQYNDTYREVRTTGMVGGESPMCGVCNYPQLVLERHEIMRTKIPLSARGFLKFTRHICEHRECYPADRTKCLRHFFEKRMTNDIKCGII